MLFCGHETTRIRCRAPGIRRLFFVVPQAHAHAHCTGLLHTHAHAQGLCVCVGALSAMQGPDGDGAAAVDSNAWSGGQRMPTAEEFSQFFLYIAFDAISERCNALALGQEPGQQEQQQQQPPYRKFVQGNKDTPWARDLLASVARVQACKAHYRAMLPMLLSRNMGPLHRVCMDITSSNVPPHREVRETCALPLQRRWPT